MELRIENDTIVRDLQKQFNLLYPYLQIHFFKAASADSRSTKKLEKAAPELAMKNLRSIQKPVYLSVGNKMTVAELLQNFRELGLLAQVCRKSGNHWVETSLTADWTLERQNSEAILISIPEA